MLLQIGPYHGARLREATTFLQDKNVELIAIETASKTQNYILWEKVGDDGFRRETLFPTKRWQDIKAGSMRKSVVDSLDRHKPDVVIVTGWMSRDTLAAIDWCRKNRRGVAVMTDSSVDDRPRSWPLEFVKRRILGCCDGGLAAGKTSVEYLKTLGMPDSQIKVGIDVVDNTFFSQTAESLRADASKRAVFWLKKPFLITPARFIPEKNLLLAIEAYAAYQREMKADAWHWVLCGDGPQRELIEKNIQLYSLKEHVHLAGFVNTEQLSEYYARCNALWLPSVRETWGLVVNEAMAASLPVLVSNRSHCYHDLVISGKNGWVFDPFSIAEMSQVLCRMTSTPEPERQQMGLAGKKIISNWGLDRFSNALWEVSQACLLRAKSRKGFVEIINRTILKAILNCR